MSRRTEVGEFGCPPLRGAVLMGTARPNREYRGYGKTATDPRVLLSPRGGDMSGAGSWDDINLACRREGRLP